MRVDDLRKLISIYRDAVKAGAGPVSPSCGLFLYLLARLLAYHRRGVRVVDIGASHGVSTLFMACGVRDGGGGRVIGIEVLQDRAEVLARNASALGLQDIVTVVKSSAEDAIDVIAGADLVFIDTGAAVEETLLRRVVEAATDRTILVLHDAVLHVQRNIHVRKSLEEAGFVTSVVPIDTGLMLAVKSELPEEFSRVAWELYRESVREGIHPVLPNTARLLHVLARTLALSTAGNMVDIGAGFGFSSLWMSAALLGTRCKLYALEVRTDRLMRLKRALADLGLDSYCETIVGDASETIERVPRPVLLALIDAEKRSYLTYLLRLEERLSQCSVIVAHNTVSHPHEMPDYLQRVYASGYLSVTALVDPGGVTISLRL